MAEKMRRLCKMTDRNMQTYGRFQWEIGVEVTAPGCGDLCSKAYLHAYTSPLLAEFLNPIHANFSNPRLFRAVGVVEKGDHGLKVGCTRLKIISEIPLRRITNSQRVAFGILCAKVVCKNPAWSSWAAGWLSGEDRSYKA